MTKKKQKDNKARKDNKAQKDGKPKRNLVRWDREYHSFICCQDGLQKNDCWHSLLGSNRASNVQC